MGGTLGLVREISFFSIPKVQTWKCPDPVFLLTLPVALCLPGFRLLPLLTTWRSHAVIFSVFAALWKVRGDNSLPFYIAYNSASAWHPSGLLQGCSLPNPVLSTLCKHTHTLPMVQAQCGSLHGDRSIVAYFSFPPEWDEQIQQLHFWEGRGKESKAPRPIPREARECGKLKLETDLLSQAQIVNLETGELSKLNMPGELYIRGYCVMQGYWDEPQKTFEAIGQDKWYRTG